MRQLKSFMKAKKPMWRCGECECLTLKCWKENDAFCNCGTSSEGPGVEYVFKDWDGTVLKKWSIDEWATPKAPADPTREWYTFIWWEPEVWPLAVDTTYVAQYEINQYTINITVNDSTMWSVDTNQLVIAYGTTISENANVLSFWEVDITATPEDWYIFTGRGVLPETVTWNMDIIATFDVGY